MDIDDKDISLSDPRHPLNFLSTHDDEGNPLTFTTTLSTASPPGPLRWYSLSNLSEDQSLFISPPPLVAPVPRRPSPTALTAGSPTPVRRVRSPSRSPSPDPPPPVMTPERHDTTYDLSTTVSGRIWFLTLFYDERRRSTADDLQAAVEAWFQDSALDIRRCVASLDWAPTTRRVHVHVAVHFFAMHRLSSFRRYFGDGNHYELGRNGWEAIEAYCRDISTGKQIFIDYNYVRDRAGYVATHNVSTPGELRSKSRVKPTQPKITPTQAFWIELQQNPRPKTFFSLVRQPRFAHMAGSMQKVMQFVSEVWTPSTEKVNRIFYYICGASGSGKSHLAYRLSGQFDSRVSVSFSPSGQLVGLRDFAECVLFDDLSLSNRNIPKELLFQLCGDRELRLDVKFGSAVYCPQLVLVTRCEDPKDLVTTFGWSGQEAYQLTRRMTRILVCRTNTEGQREIYDSKIDEVISAELLEAEIRDSLLTNPDPQTPSPSTAATQPLPNPDTPPHSLLVRHDDISSDDTAEEETEH